MLKALVIFGSSTFSRDFKDLDLLVVIDRLDSIIEKLELELSISKSLRDLRVEKPFDVIVLDTESLKENAIAGGFVTGLILGHRVIYDDVGIKDLIGNIAKELASIEDYIIVKRGRKLNLSVIAMVRSSTND